MDLLDIIFRLERMFDMNIGRKEVQQLFDDTSADAFSPGDITAFVLRRMPRYEVLNGVIHADVLCNRCGYNLRGLPTIGECPECRRGASLEAQVWQGVCDVLEDAIGVERSKIRPNSSLRRDLGASF